MPCIWGPRLRGCMQTEQPIRARFTFRRATRPPPPRQLTADSGVTPPGRGAVIFSIAAAQGSAGNSLLNTVSPGGLPFRASWEWWLPLEVALLAGEHCLPSAWEEGWGGVGGGHGYSRRTPCESCRRARRTRASLAPGAPWPQALPGRELPGTFHTRPSLGLQIGGSERDTPPPLPRAVAAF